MKKIKRLMFLPLFGLICSCKGTVPFARSTQFYMDTYCECLVYGNNKIEENQYLAKAFDILGKVELAADPTHVRSELYRLNTDRSISNPSKELKEMLEYALLAKEDTEGLYNPFVANLKQMVNEFKILDEKSVEKETYKANNTSLTITDESIKIEGDANIDLGGIAKGYAIERIKEEYKGINGYLINAGSSSILLGEKPDSSTGEFVIELVMQNLKFKAKNTYISTSGIENQYWYDEEQNLISHIINPLTGSFSPLHQSVTILGQDGALGDAYTTAMMNMEMDDIKTFCKDKNYEYIVVSGEIGNSTIYHSSGVNIIK